MSDLLPVFVVVVTALSVFFFFMIARSVIEGIYWWLFKRNQEPPLLADKLHQHLEAVRPPRTIGDRMDRFFERMVGRSELELSGSQAAAYLLLIGVLAAGGIFLWQDRLELVMAAGVASMVGLLGVFWIFHWRWRQRVQNQLPDTFHLLARSLRAGLTVDQSIQLIATQGDQPLAGEFKRCSEHLQLGMTLPAALQMTAMRIGLPDFSLLASLVTMHRQTGGNLPQVLDRLSAAVRARNQFRGQVAAVTALGRLSGYFLALAAPAFMIFYWVSYPSYLMRLTESNLGLIALSTAVVLEIVGVIWMSFLLRIDY